MCKKEVTGISEIGKRGGARKGENRGGNSTAKNHLPKTCRGLTAK